jgi:hypothetical protein
VSLKVKRRGTVVVTMDDEYAGKVWRSLGRAMDALGHMDQQEQRYEQLVNTGTIDDLLALRTAIINVMPDAAEKGIPVLRAERGHR